VVRIDPRYYRPTEVQTLLGDPSKAKRKLGWVPTTDFRTLVREMAIADFTSARRDSMLKTAGFPTFDFHARGRQPPLTDPFGPVKTTWQRHVARRTYPPNGGVSSL